MCLNSSDVAGGLGLLVPQLGAAWHGRSGRGSKLAQYGLTQHGPNVQWKSPAGENDGVGKKNTRRFTIRSPSLCISGTLLVSLNMLAQSTVVTSTNPAPVGPNVQVYFFLILKV